MIPYTVYLSGEIHSNWREEIAEPCVKKDLGIKFIAGSLDHEKSDSIGADILGEEDNNFWYDHKAAKINSIKRSYLMDLADLVVVRFGDKYKQWNAAFEAGYAIAKGIPLITLHSKELIHPLKEIDASAYAWAETPEQVSQILEYIRLG